MIDSGFRRLRKIAVWGFLCLLMGSGVVLFGEKGTTLPAGVAAPAKVHAFMWKVSSPTNSVYLVGSMHLASPEMYPLPAEMEKAFADSGTLVVEVDITKVDQAKMLKMVMDSGMYKGEDTVEKHVTSETMTALKAFCEKHGMPLAGMEKMKPWCLSLMVEVTGMQDAGLDPDLGIDKHFLDQDKGKKVVELESAEGQLKMLDGFDDKVQEKVLAAALKGPKEMKEGLAKMVAAWKSGDAAAMQALLTKEMGNDAEAKTFMVKMFDERNSGMAEKIEALLKGDKPVFVVVGAGHLVGEKGLLKLLGAKGFKVEQPEVTAAAATRP